MLLTSLALAAAVLPLGAQEHLASIRGVVVDRAAAGLPRVEVRTTREETGESRRVRTDHRGRFVVSQLPPGTYRVEVDHRGYGPALARIALVTNQEYRLELQLQPGTVLHATDVPAPFSPVDRSSATLTTFIDTRFVTALPLENRNFLDLTLLAPGTARAPNGVVTVNGARQDANTLLLDGVSDAEPRVNGPAVRPPVDGIREFQVLTSNYDAAFGRSAGGQINVVTKSGTGRLTGSAYELFRGGALAARNYFAPADGPAPEYSRQEFGGSAGGPIVPKRVFFFADYDRTRLREGVTRIATVPTAAERSGDFSGASGGAPVNPLTGQPFAAGVLPLAVQDPAGRALAALYPLPNRTAGGGNYVSSPVRRADVDQLDVRVDSAFTGGARLTGRYSVGDRRRFEPFAGPGAALVPGFGSSAPRRAQNAAVSFTHAPREALSNDVRVGYTRVATGAAAESAGIGGAVPGLPLTSPSGRGAAPGVIVVSGLSPLGSLVPAARVSDTFQISDAATWAHGTHLVKFGGEWYGVRQRATPGGDDLGVVAFGGPGRTGNAVADLLLGLPALSATAAPDLARRLRSHSWGLFAQDNWRPTEALTLTAGVRYEVSAAPVDPAGRAHLYDTASGVLVRAGSEGLPAGGYATDRNNVAPRAGFSWVMDREQKNLLRAGYGIYYNQSGTAASEAMFLNPPYFNPAVRVPVPGSAPLPLAEAFAAGRVLPASLIAYGRDLQTPWMEHWNVNVQHQVGQTRSFEAGYVGSRGHALLDARPLGAVTPGGANVTAIESRATSAYRALQIRYQERPAHTMSLLMSYTLGRSVDTASGLFPTTGDPNVARTGADPGAERSRSSFDVRHRFSAAILRPLPIGTGGTLLGTLGWFSDVLRNIELAAVVTLETGRPFTVTRPSAVDGATLSELTFGAGSRPNVTGNPALKMRLPERWFDTAAFSLPPDGAAGNSGRNTLDGPGYGDVSVALVKRIFFLQQGTLEFRVEAFNVLDHANFDLPDAVVGSPTFGRVLSAGSPRRLQLGVRAEF